MVGRYTHGGQRGRKDGGGRTVIGVGTGRGRGTEGGGAEGVRIW
jgi:hypothetical protein